MDPENILPQLKGAPCSVLAALLLVGRPLGTHQLARLTGWSDTQVSLALRRLAELGLIESTGRYSGWQLAGPALPRLFQLLLQATLRLSQSNPELLGGWLEGLVEGETRGCGEAETRREGGRTAIGKTKFWGSLGWKPKFRGSLGEKRGRGDAETRGKGGGAGDGKPKFRGSPGGKPKFHGSRSLKVVVVDSSLKRLKLNTTTTPNAPARASPVEPILAAAQALFGEQVFFPPGWKPDAGQLLGWIAAVYHRPGSLRYPARAVYAHLKRGDPPDPAYRRDPLRYLPAGFLEQAGLSAPASRNEPEAGGALEGGEALQGGQVLLGQGPERCVQPGGAPAPGGAPEPGEAPGACGAPSGAGGPGQGEDLEAGGAFTGQREAGGEEEPGEARDPPEPSLRLRVSLRSEHSAESAWQKAADLLRLEMRPETFARYVQPARLVHYDPQEGLFSVAAPDEFTRQWLAERLSRMAGSTLAGICARSVQVRFVLPEAPKNR